MIFWRDSTHHDYHRLPGLQHRSLAQAIGIRQGDHAGSSVPLLGGISSGRIQLVKRTHPKHMGIIPGNLNPAAASPATRPAIKVFVASTVPLGLCWW
jgi:hypothetical protein